MALSRIEFRADFLSAARTMTARFGANVKPLPHGRGSDSESVATMAIPHRPEKWENGGGMTLQELRATRRASVLGLAAKHGAYNVRVFGSVARGDSDPQSDVDFLVDLEPGRSLSDLGGLLMGLEEALGAPVDVVTERGLRVRVRERVLAEAVPL